MESLFFVRIGASLSQSKSNDSDFRFDLRIREARAVDLGGGDSERSR